MPRGDQSYINTPAELATEAGISGGSGVPSSRTISTTAPLTGGGDLSANRTLALADTAVTPGSYTNTSLTVDAKGRLTAASSGPTPAVATRAIGAAGLASGGGDLSADRTITVTAGLVGDIQPVGTAAAAGASGKAADAAHVHAHGAQTDGTLHAAAVAGGASGFMTGADKTKLDSIQTGTVTLVAGTVTKNTGIVITAGSKVYVSLNTPGGTAGARYKVPDASLTVGGAGVGAFVATAVDAAGDLVNTDTSTLNYLIVG